MPCIITTVHNPVALVATCRRLNIPPPQEGCVHLEDREASGWIVRLSGVRYPIVCDMLTGLVAYHPADNAFGRYARIMSFVQVYYRVQHKLRQSENDTVAFMANNGQIWSRRPLARPKRFLSGATMSKMMVFVDYPDEEIYLGRVQLLGISKEEAGSILDDLWARFENERDEEPQRFLEFAEQARGDVLKIIEGDFEHHIPGYNPAAG